MNSNYTLIQSKVNLRQIWNSSPCMDLKVKLFTKSQRTQQLCKNFKIIAQTSNLRRAFTKIQVKLCKNRHPSFIKKIHLSRRTKTRNKT